MLFCLMTLFLVKLILNENRLFFVWSWLFSWWVLSLTEKCLLCLFNFQFWSWVFLCETYLQRKQDFFVWSWVFSWWDLSLKKGFFCLLTFFLVKLIFKKKGFSVCWPFSWWDLSSTKKRLFFVWSWFFFLGETQDHQMGKR